MMTTLDEIGLAHGTDKSSTDHDYLNLVYADLFAPLRDKPITLVELGIYQGASLRMWDDYFTHPDRHIHGVDINPDAWSSDRPHVTTHQRDQATPLGVIPDIIVDDASHLSVKTIESFRAWFPRLRPGGLYIIEDIVTSYYYPHAPREQTAMQFCQQLADGVNGYPIGATRSCGLSWIQFHKNIVVMKKGNQ